MKNITKLFFPTLVMITAIGLAITAAYFSVTGLSKLFAGAKEAVIVMASILELAKIVTASWLHRHWAEKEISKVLKTQLSIVVFVLMCITSAGIYGFLSSAYFETSNKLNKIDTEISLLDKQKIIFDSKINNLNNLKKAKTDRIQSLTTLRSQQESRIDSLYKKNMISAVKRTENQIKDANNEINSLLKEVDGIDRNIQTQNDSITKIELRKADVSDNDVASEIGPLKYIAKLTGASMDSVINWFILALIFVFDPLAIALIIAANISMEKIKKTKETEEYDKKETKTTIQEENFEKENNKEGVEKESSDKKEENTATEKEENKIPSKIIEFIEQNQQKEEEFKKKIEELSKNKEKEIESKNETIESKEVLEIKDEKQEISEKNQETELSFEEENKIKEEKRQRDTLYLKILGVLYRNGELKEGEEIPSYAELKKDLDKQGVEYTDKVIRDFLTACNLVKVVDTSEGKRIALKSFEKAKEIISNI